MLNILSKIFKFSYYILIKDGNRLIFFIFYINNSGNWDWFKKNLNGLSIYSVDLCIEKEQIISLGIFKFKILKLTD